MGVLARFCFFDQSCVFRATVVAMQTRGPVGPFLRSLSDSSSSDSDYKITVYIRQAVADRNPRGFPYAPPPLRSLSSPPVVVVNRERGVVGLGFGGGAHGKSEVEGPRYFANTIARRM